jgi:hypothetical protein
MAQPISVAVRDTAASEHREGSYVDWACALAGAVTAAGISSILLTFGSGIGFSMLSPWEGSAVSVTTFVIITTLWAILAQIAAFGTGGYLAGRMRRPWKDATDNEVEFRDGAHGLLVWATGVVIGAMLLALAAGGAVGTATQVAGAAATSSAASAADPTAYAVDTLLRTDRPQENINQADIRSETTRAITRAIGPGNVSDTDRAYLTQLVISRTGLAQPEAEQRVNQVITQAQAAADRARKTGIVAAFLTAASLLAGAAVAWWAARVGGQHRNQGTVWRGFDRTGRRVSRPAT